MSYVNLPTGPQEILMEEGIISLSSDKDYGIELYAPNIMQDGFNLFYTKSLVDLIEAEVRRGIKFTVRIKLDDGIDELAWQKQLDSNEPTVLIGYGGEATYPAIVNPQKKWGTTLVDVDKRRLVYSRKGISLENMRDAYTWSYNAGNDFYIYRSLSEIFDDFKIKKYGFSQADFQDYCKKFQPFKNSSDISWEEFLRNL